MGGNEERENDIPSLISPRVYVSCSSHHRQSSLTGSLTDRSYSPDYCRTQDDTRYRSHGTPPPGPGTPHGTPYGTPKMPRSSALSSRSHRRKSVEPDPEGTGGCK